uniref:Uncharacterized protein n=1 Tax=Solanum lycopersicum TaxID=4081 RepID=A0A3Q7GUW0_SOLLC
METVREPPEVACWPLDKRQQGNTKEINIEQQTLPSNSSKTSGNSSLNEARNS